MSTAHPVRWPCRPRRCRRWPAWAFRTDRARGSPLVILGRQTPWAGADPPHGIPSGLARHPSLALLRCNPCIVMNDTDKGEVVVAQSIFAAVGNQRGKALRRAELPVQPLP